MPTVHWKRIGGFYATALGSLAFVCSPLWLDRRGLGAPYFSVVALAGMLTPALAAWLSVHEAALDAAARKDAFALRRPALPTSSIALAIALPLTFALGAIALGSWLGRYEFDANLSGYAAKIGKPIAHPARTALIAIASVIPAGFVNALPALGEELGWRGFLVYELRALPPLGADILIGALWGLWHMPLTLRGYNYPNAPVLGALLLMPCMCMLMAIWIGWLRRRSNSVLIAALAHGTMNAAATLALLFYRTGYPPNPVQTTITGWTGWLLPLGFAAWLVWSQRSVTKR